MAKLYQEIDQSILKAIPNPSKEAYEIKIKIPEFTFLGVKEQPDFATVFITMYPSDKIIELKSLKLYSFHLIYLLHLLLFSLVHKNLPNLMESVYMTITRM